MRLWAKETINWSPHHLFLNIIIRASLINLPTCRIFTLLSFLIHPIPWNQEKSSPSLSSTVNHLLCAMHYAQDLPSINVQSKRVIRASVFWLLGQFYGKKTPKHKTYKGNISEMSMSDVGYNVQKLKGKISLSGELKKDTWMKQDLKMDRTQI